MSDLLPSLDQDHLMHLFKLTNEVNSVRKTLVQHLNIVPRTHRLTIHLKWEKKIKEMIIALLMLFPWIKQAEDFHLIEETQHKPNKSNISRFHIKLKALSLNRDMTQSLNIQLCMHHTQRTEEAYHRISLKFIRANQILHEALLLDILEIYKTIIFQALLCPQYLALEIRKLFHNSRQSILA